MALDYFTITINGLPVVTPMAEAIVRVIVDTNLYMPSMFEIHLRDEPKLEIYPLIDSPQLAIGSTVKISAKSVGKANLPASVSIPGALITGEITALEPHFSEDGSATLVVRGYDKTHRLHNGRKTKTYLMQMDNTIVQSITSSCGLTATAMPTTSGMHEYVLQNNQTDMEFLRSIAVKNGYILAMNAEGILEFKNASIPIPGPALTWLENLVSFSPRATAAGQVATAMVHAWSPLMKQGVDIPMPVIPAVTGGPALAADRGLALGVSGGEAKDVTTDQPIALPTEATALAMARGTKISQDFLQADGTCLGHPQVVAGRTVTILKVGLKFSGPYLITSATHIYDQHGYTTTFHANGSEAKILTTLLANENPEPGRIYGVVNGIVTDNMDTLGQGRVKVKFPFLGSQPPVESNWCRVASPMAGSSRGFYNIPEVNDEVLVAFEQGDVNFPYVVGSLWNTVDLPPMPSTAVVVGGKVTKRIWKTPAGHILTLDDTPGAEMISIVDKTAGNKIEIASTPPGAITISVSGDCTIEANNKVSITSKAQDVEISCTNFKVTANASIQLSANANLQLKATAQASIEGTAGVTMKDGAGAQIAMNGPAVNVNNGALEVI